MFMNRHFAADARRSARTMAFEAAKATAARDMLTQQARRSEEAQSVPANRGSALCSVPSRHTELALAAFG